MGILNMTDDSFFSGSRITDNMQLIEKAHQMVNEGAAILDIGAVSTRPGSVPVSSEVEIMAVRNAVGIIRKEFPEILISVDTFRSEVAQIAAGEGADIINDISAGTNDPSMTSIVAQEKLPYIMMHMQGTPETMQNNPVYHNVVNDVIALLAEKIQCAHQHGVTDVFVDPGFGFGKTSEHNFELLDKLSLFRILNAPVVVGLSRKSMIYRTLGCTPEEALNGTSALHAVAIQNGADILRVHDVGKALEVITLMQHLHNV